MMYFYKEGGFYLKGVNAIPKGAVEISDEYYEQLIFEQSEGKVIISNLDGTPMAVEPPPSPFHHFQNGKWQISESKKVELLAAQQAEVWEKIKQRRYENGLGGVFIQSVGKWFQTGEEEKTKYLGLDKVIDKLGEINWKCADNTFVKMNRALLDEIFLMMVKTENADHINAERHRLAMLAVENPLDYDFSAGWSAIYQEADND